MQGNIQDNIILIIFVILFFVLPSVMKLLGRRVSGAGSEPEEKNLPMEKDSAPGHPYPGTDHEILDPDFSRRQDYGPSGYTEISNEPIHPKWF
ncbi:MAG: hypothetical protein WAR22_13005 [Desulfomonilia bacterium]|jgi:hypothetical protein